MKGYQFALAGPIYAGTNEIQRNVVAERVPRAARRAMRVRPFTDDQLAFRDAVRDLLDEGVHARARARRVDERHRPRPRPVGHSSSRWAWSACSRPRPRGGLGLTFVDLVLLLEETGRHAVPEPIVETAARGRAAARRPDLVVASRHALVPWADTADVVDHRRRPLRPRDDDARSPRPSVDGARRLFEVAGDRDTGRRRSRPPFDRGVLRSPRRSSAGSPTACSS